MNRPFKSFLKWSLRSDLGGIRLALGGADLASVFSTTDTERFEGLFRSRTDRLLEDLAHDPDPRIRAILSGLRFKASLSDRLNAHSQRLGPGQYLVEVNRGLIAFYVLMNALVTDTLNEPDMAMLLQGGLKRVVNGFVSIHLYLVGDSVERGEFVIDIDPLKKGLLIEMGLRDGDMIAMPWHMAWDHQLEFLLLHELGHYLTSGDEQPHDAACEFTADKYALATSRQIWRNAGAYHTSYCELFQLITFLYLDLHEFMLHGVENITDRTALAVGVSLAPRQFRHPPAFLRFCRAIDGIDRVSHMGRMLFQMTEQLFNSVKISVIRGEVDLRQFDRLAAARFHARLERHAKRHGGPASLVPPTLKGLRDTWTPETWMWHLPVTERGKAISVLMDDAHTPFYEALAGRFGECESFRAMNESLQGFRIM